MDLDALAFRGPAARRGSNGEVRIGGPWQTPSYLLSYGKAAKLLLKQAQADNDVDEVVLPLVYLVRHTAELALKYLLDDAIEIARNSARLDRSERVERSKMVFTHDLRGLVKETTASLQAIGYQLPCELIELVELIEAFERGSPERARYHEIKQGKGSAAPLVQSMGEAVSIPVARLMEKLEAVLMHFGYVSDSDVENLPLAQELYYVNSTYLNKLYSRGDPI